MFFAAIDADCGLPRFASALKAIESLKPTEPLYLVHPAAFASAVSLATNSVAWRVITTCHRVRCFIL